jgi:hypothetical protein
MKAWIKNLDRETFGSGKYSQSYQDELLNIVFENIGTLNPVPFCIEFGFNSSSLAGGSGANVARLVIEKNWDSLLLDGDNENAEIKLYRQFLMPSNICEIFRQHHVPKEPEYISIDVDSTDLWLFEAVVKEYRAMVFSVEYNCNYPLGSAITFPNDPKERWQGDRGYGASLKALNMVANSHGYSLLWVVPRLDAFFIRNDLIDDGSSQMCFPFEKWASHTSCAIHAPLKDRQRAKIFIDYQVYISTNGDLEASRRAALPICRKTLLDSLYRRALRKAKQTARKMIWPSKRMESND